jgi:hypothetical protein
MPNIDRVEQIDKLVIKDGDDLVELRFGYPEPKVVSSLDEITETGIYSGEDLFDPDSYVSPF